MNKFNTIILMLSLTLGMPAFADEIIEGAYLSIGGGLHKPKQWGDKYPKHKEGRHLKAAVGHKFCNWRIEFEPGYLSFKGDKELENTRIITTIGNLYYDLPINDRIYPYIGVGMGWGSIKREMQVNNLLVTGKTVATDVRAVYQGIIGIKMHISNEVGINLDYRYLETDKLPSRLNGDKSLSHRMAHIGISYHF